jgi:hypothetical protein
MMAVEKDAWEREGCMKHATVVVDDVDEDEDDSNNFDYSWGQVHREKRRDIRHGQKHEAKVVRVNGRLSVAGDTDSKGQVRSCSHSDGCAEQAGADDNTKRVPDADKVIVGLAYRLAQRAQPNARLRSK